MSLSLLPSARRWEAFSARSEELQRGELLWRPFDLPALDQLQVGIVVPAQRVLPHVTQNFVGRMSRRLTQLESTAASL